MTNQEFFEQYKGRRVRVNQNAISHESWGREGVVYGVIAYGIRVSMDDYADPSIFDYYKLDVIEEKRQKITPLPLPG